MDEILEILEKDARLTSEEIAVMTGKSTAEVEKRIKKYESEGVILKYKAVVNKEAVETDVKIVRALIEVKVIPQRNVGFDAIAKRIYSFSAVKSCYLLSGGYDLLVIVEGEDMHSVSSFVSEKLATLENVQGTVTHFLLKKYKEDGDILHKIDGDKRLSISF
ncbi:MAG: Lrp/AsnC family transcriptional regulator [Candidatus Theseobacter exili]|nr:Lrp/AsnC family transcriptional regulator [Candidatus Theseobacter exili]